MIEGEFLFGPLGGMVPLAVEPGVSVEAGRARSEFVSSAGVRWARQASRNPRTWSGAMTLQTDEAARLVDVAAHSPGVPFFLYDTGCARRNLLPSRDTQGAPASRTNIWPNPSWESGIKQGSFTPASSLFNVAVATDWFERGTQSLKLTPKGNAGYGDVRLYTSPSTDQLGISPLTTYTFSATIRMMNAPGATVTAGRGIFFEASTGVTDKFAVGSALPARDGVYRPVFTFTTPEDVTSFTLELNVLDGMVAGAAVWVDSMTLEKGVTQGAYFDGATPGYMWSGTANASSSVPATVKVAGVPLPPVNWTRRKAYVIAGRTYTLSAWTSGVHSGVGYRIGTGTSEYIPYPTNGYSAATFTPSNSGEITIIRDAGYSAAGIRLHEGLPDGLYYATDGTPTRVETVDPSRTYQLTAQQRMLTDHEIELKEIGLPGQF